MRLSPLPKSSSARVASPGHSSPYELNSAALVGLSDAGCRTLVLSWRVRFLSFSLSSVSAWTL